MSLGVSGGADLTGNLLFNWVADLLGDRVAHLSGNRVAFLSGNRVADFSGDRNTLLLLTGNLDLDWVAVGDWLRNAHDLSDRLG